ncbi:MAG: IS1634 family transposase, partial [Pseudomonadota bacterium]
GLLTDPRGCPVAVSVHEGNTADAQTLLPQVQRLKDEYGIAQFVMVGDRGMISQKAIDALHEQDGIGWITALKSTSIRALVEQGDLQLGLFDERNLFEFSHPDYPGERLVACRNPELAKRRAHKREALLAATEKNLEAVRAAVEAGRLRGQDKIGLRVGKLVNQYKVAKHFALDIGERAFSYRRLQDSIAAEAALDGLYVIRTAVSAAQMSSDDCVRHYKSLANVERAFRSLKTVDLKVRPIHHRLAERVRAHIFLCMLAYYVEWHLREAWRELMFADEDQTAKNTRDPVAPAQRSPAALAKAATHTLDDGTPAHSFATLLADLSTIVRNTCRTPGASPGAPTFDILTTATPQQKRALELVQNIAA